MRRVLFLYLLIALSLLGGELYLRRTSQQPPAHPDFPPRPHMGSLDMPYPREKTPGISRVLIIGDSYVMADTIPAEQRFTEILASYDPRLELVTLALPGANTPMMLDGWKEYGRDAGADIVIVAIAVDDNDLGLLERPQVGTVAQKIVPGSYLAAWFDERLFYFETFGKPPFNQVLNDHQPTERLWLSILEKFRADIEAHGAKAWALVLSQPFYDTDAETLYSYAYVAGVAERAGFTTFNFLPAYQAHYGDLRYPLDRWAIPSHDNHYNAEAHAVIARWLWGLLEGELG